MAKFSDIWTQLEQAGGPLPFLLIDCAGLPGGEAQIPKDLFSELECLFTGDLADELADVGPYLGRLQSFDPAIASVVEDLLESHVGTLVVVVDPPPDAGTLTFSQMHRHFRKFNVVYGPDAEPLFFRYYDPRVILDVLKVFEPSQLEEFFGPVESLVLVSNSKRALRCLRNAGTLMVMD